MRYLNGVRSTRWPLASCALLCGLLAACSQNKGPATNAYLRECESFSAKLAGQIRDLPKIEPPSRPALPASPTEDQRRVYEGMTRIYPLYVNQYYAAVMERCRAVSQLYSQALDGIGSLNAAGVDPAGVQVMTLQVQLLDQERDFFGEVRSLADLNQTALVHRKAVDRLDEMLVRLFGSAIGGGPGGGRDDAAAAVAAGLKEVAGAVSMRQGEPFGIGAQVARVAEHAAKLQHDTAAYQAERARLWGDLKARFPDQDWGAIQPKQGQAGP
jgi:hypothetical protein